MYGIVHIAPLLERYYKVEKKTASLPDGKKEGRHLRSNGDRRGYLVPVADLDETFVKQNVTKIICCFEHVRLKMNMITAAPDAEQLMLK